MKHNKLKNTITVVLLLLFSFLIPVQVEAIQYPSGCLPPNGVPLSCQTDFEPDFSCINKGFLDPTVVCCPNKCKGDPPSDIDENISNVINVFGSRFNLRLSSEQTIAMLVNLVITTTLGIISLYVLFRGIYVAAFLRTSTTDSARIEAISKELRNLFIGFLLAWGAIFVVQFVSTALGLGSLNDLNISNPSGEGTYVITIQ